MSAHIVPNYADPRRGLLDITVYPGSGAAGHRVSYFRGEKPPWLCDCPRGAGCPWIQHIRQHPDVPDMEGI